jgi:CBS domain-containing protein
MTPKNPAPHTPPSQPKTAIEGELLFKNQNLVCIDHLASPQEALKLMTDRGIHHLVVTKREQAVGIVSDRDLYQDLYRELLSPENPRPPTNLGTLATPGDARLSRETTLKEALEWMIDRRKSAIPISENGQVIGLMTSTDMVQALYLHLSKFSDLSGTDSSESSLLDKGRAAINAPLSNPLMVNLMQLLSEAGI